MQPLPPSHRLAEALAARLNEVVPPPFRVVAREDLLYVYIGSKFDSAFSLDIVDDETRDASERVQTAAVGVINTLQDDISEDKRIPWPSRDGRTMALADGRVEGNWVHLWYGDRENPVLMIPPINIEEIVGTASG